MELAPYVITVFVLGGLAFAAFVCLLTRVLGPHRPYPEKNSTYEAGVDPIGDAHVRIRVGYYTYALLFVIFDIETVFLFPWAVTFGRLGAGLFVLVEMLVFLVLLAVGLIYAWREGALKWR